MHTLYSNQPSGNCYKLRLAMAQLNIAFSVKEIDSLNNETRTPEFLAMNPNGKVPTLVLDDGLILPESNAALYYLASESPLLSDDRFTRAQTLQWMFFEQYSHEPYIAVARAWWSLKPGARQAKAAAFPELWQRGHAALAVMEQHLASHDWFAGGRYSIADIALYAYTHRAHEGNFDLAGYRAINGWLARVANVDGHVTIDWCPA